MAIIRVMPSKSQQIGTFKLSDLRPMVKPTVDVMSVAPGSTPMDELFLKFSGADNYTDQFNATIEGYTKELAQQNEALQTAATVSRADALKKSGESISNFGTGAAAIMQENISDTVQQQYETAYTSAIAQYASKVSAIQSEFTAQMKRLFGNIDANGRFSNIVDFASKAVIANNALLNMLAQQHSELMGIDLSESGKHPMAYLEEQGYIVNEIGGYTITEAGYDYIDSIINAHNFEDANLDNLINQIIADEYGTEFSALDEDEQYEIKNEWRQWLFEFSDSWRYSGLGLINDDGTVDNMWTSDEGGDPDIAIETGRIGSVDLSNISFKANDLGSKKWEAGDNIALNVDGRTVSVDIASEHKELLRSRTVRDLTDGAVFVYDGAMYVKTNNSVYEIQYNFFTDGNLGNVLRKLYRSEI